MLQRGRKSAASIAVVPDLTGRGAPALVPPEKLAPDVLVAWNRVVTRVPVGWFCVEQVDLLVAYAEAVAGGRRMRKAARVADISLDDYRTIIGIAQREEALSLSFARALRLTVQSRVQAATAGRRAGAGTRQPSIDVLFDREDGRDEA